MLNLVSNHDTILVSPDYLKSVEEIASNTPDQPTKHHHTNGPQGQDDTTPGTDQVTPPPVEPPVEPDTVNNPLQNLGNHIKDGLTGGGQTPTVDHAINEVVNGIGELVDGLLGQ